MILQSLALLFANSYFPGKKNKRSLPQLISLKCSLRLDNVFFRRKRIFFDREFEQEKKRYGALNKNVCRIVLFSDTAIFERGQLIEGAFLFLVSEFF
jgi:hypothetical protein